jgi:hypothetical protein
LFEARDNLADQTARDGVGLGENECFFDSHSEPERTGHERKRPAERVRSR